MQVETCTTPDRGYGGDPKRGASMGRGDRDAETLRANARERVADLERTLESYRRGENAHMYRPPAMFWLGASGENGAPFTSLEDALARYESLLVPAREELEALEASASDTRFHLRKVRLDSGGYDPGGAYWGHGGELFEAWNGAGDFMTVRIGSREAAKDAIRADYPRALFFR